MLIKSTDSDVLDSLLEQLLHKMRGIVLALLVVFTGLQIALALDIKQLQQQLFKCENHVQKLQKSMVGNYLSSHIRVKRHKKDYEKYKEEKKDYKYYASKDHLKSHEYKEAFPACQAALAQQTRVAKSK